MDNSKHKEIVQEIDDHYNENCIILRPVRLNVKNVRRRLMFLEDRSLIEHIDTDGEFVVSTGTKYDIDVWDIIEGTHMRNLSGHEGLIVGLKLQAIGMQETGPIDRIVISASADGFIIQWSVHTDASEYNFYLETSAQLRTNQNAIELKISLGEKLRKIETGNVFTCMATMNKVFAVTGNNNGRLDVYNLSSGLQQYSVYAHSDPIDALVVNKEYICTAVLHHCNLRIWILNSMIQCIYELEDHCKIKFNAFAIYNNALVLGDALAQQLHFMFFKRKEKFIVQLQQRGGQVQQINISKNYITSITTDETGMIFLHNQCLQKLNSIVSFPCYYMQKVLSVALLTNKSMMKFIIGGSALVIFDLNFPSIENVPNHDQKFQHDKCLEREFSSTLQDNTPLKQTHNEKYPEKQIISMRQKFSQKESEKIKILEKFLSEEGIPQINEMEQYKEHTEFFINSSNINETSYANVQHKSNYSTKKDERLLNEIEKLSELQLKETEKIDRQNETHIIDNINLNPSKDNEIIASENTSQNERNKTCTNQEPAQMKYRKMNKNLESANVKQDRKKVTFGKEHGSNQKKSTKKRGSKKKKCLLM